MRRLARSSGKCHSVGLPVLAIEPACASRRASSHSAAMRATNRCVPKSGPKSVSVHITIEQCKTLSPCVTRRAEQPADHLVGGKLLRGGLDPPAGRRLVARPRFGPGRVVPDGRPRASPRPFADRVGRTGFPSSTTLSFRWASRARSDFLTAEHTDHTEKMQTPRSPPPRERPGKTTHRRGAEPAAKNADGESRSDDGPRKARKTR